MGIRTIRTEKEELLRKVSKPVKKFDQSLWQLLDDMTETMHMADGIGLAAPQIGILRRVFTIDIGDGLLEFVNPEILEAEGEQLGEEGCLSVPKKYGQVRRANHVKIRAQDRHGDFFEIEGEELMARAMLHEYDHLEGRLFIDFVEGDLIDAADK